MKKILLLIGCVLALVFGAHVVGYVVALRSDAYAVAKAHVEKDGALAQQIGAVSEVSLAPLDAELRFTMDSGAARFVVSARTDRGERKIRILLDKIGTEWRVKTLDVIG
jgi:putative heme degradation protein